MDRVARRGPLKGGTSEIVNIFVAVEGGTIWRKKIEKKVSRCRKTEKGDPLVFFNIHSVAKHQEIEGGKFPRKIFGKKISVPNKTERDPLGFSNIHSDAKKQKKFERGAPLVSPGIVCYAEKQEKPFWFSSLGQMVQFGAIIFCRTFKNYFGQFVWIEKKSL